MAGRSDTDTYLAFFTGAIEYSIFRLARCPHCADLLGIRTRMDACNWAAEEIKGNIGDGERLHADSLGAIADASVRTFALMGTCRFLLYTTRAMARE